MTQRPLYYINDGHRHDTARLWAVQMAKHFGHEARELAVQTAPTSDAEHLEAWSELAAFTEKQDASMLVFELTNNHDIQPMLNHCRQLRIPYLAVRAGMAVNLDSIALPVTFLMEEKEKGLFASAFGRFFQSKICIFAPKDYGSKARQNINAISSLFDSFNLNYHEVMGHKDSNGVEMEATLAAPQQGCGMTIITASRDYGLDDLLFGCKERHILKRAQIPVLLINPRNDLYALCD